MPSRLTDGPSDNACHVGDCIERMSHAGWSVMVHCGPTAVCVSGYRGDDHATVTIAKGDLIKNLRLALATLARRIKV